MINSVDLRDGGSMAAGAQIARFRRYKVFHRVSIHLALLAALLAGVAFAQSGLTYLGQWTVNPYASNSVSSPYGLYGSRYASNGLSNPYGRYGSAYSPTSAANPYATRAPMLYDSSGSFRGTLSANRYDADSISNPYGRYGSPYSHDSINNPYGAGSRYRWDSPLNPYGTGWGVFGR
jgi:hypothetical protein